MNDFLQRESSRPCNQRQRRKMADKRLRTKLKKGTPARKRDQTVRNRLKSAGRTYRANDNISDALRPGDLDAIERDVERCAGALLNALVIDTINDHNTTGTAKRIAKMFVHEIFAGRYQPPPRCTDFPNVRSMDEIYVVGPIAVRSACSHHFCPVEGEVWFGVIPGKRVIGLSKFSRIASWIFARPQMRIAVSSFAAISFNAATIHSQAQTIIKS